MTIFDIKLYNKIIASQGKLMALDVGTKRIGLAMSDYSRFLATPHLIINCQSYEKDFAIIKKIIDENNVLALILGYPTHIDGKINEMTIFVENFAKKIDEFFENKMPIFLFDERLSSFEAKEVARDLKNRKNKKYIDDIAAALILESFLKTCNF